MWQALVKYGGKLDPKIAVEAFSNTLLIDGLIESFEPDTHQRLPTLPYKNPFEEMGKRAIQGVKDLGLADRGEYKRQLLYEFKVIKEKGFANYFLTTQRVIKEAKKQMLSGAGPGASAAARVRY